MADGSTRRCFAQTAASHELRGPLSGIPSISITEEQENRTNQFAHAGSPADKILQAEYDNGPYAHLSDDIMKGFAATAPANADVAKAIVNVVDMPFGKRPFRVHIDPAQDGAEIVNGVADRVRTEMYRNIGLSDLLTPFIS